MSANKRVRLTDDEAARAGLTSFASIEGKRWLYKALNPADASQAAIGIPAKDFNNISVLNYQSNFEIAAPSSVTPANPSYDVDLFLMQNPLLFGVSFAYPTGTMDLSEVRRFQMAYTGTISTADGYVTLTPSEAPMRSVAFRMAQQLMNSQINPTVFGGSMALSSRRLLFSQLAQKSKITYGSATIIPTCSEMNNGGAISVCQQICQPRKTPLSQNSTIMLNTFNNADFPDVEDTVQNPQMYYARFFDGAYIPYKLREPDSTNYTPTERQVTSRAPYNVIGVSAIGVTAYAAANNYTIGEIPMVLTPSATSTTFTLRNSTPFFCLADNAPAVTAIRFYIVTLTGQKGYFDFSLQNPVGLGVNPSEVFFTSDAQTTPINTVLRPQYANEGARTAPDPVTISLSSLGALSMRIPEYVTMYLSMGDGELENPYGTWFFSQDIVFGPAVSRELFAPTIPDNVGATMAAVHMTGVSSTAPIKVNIRFGIEILLTAGSPYSPFKFVSPKYDENALKSYIRCARVMRDAFYANAGIDAGQADFMQRLGTLIEYDSPDDLLRILNQGGRWQGTIGG